MSGLETAIRNALARSERANAEVRARIYQSARNALEAGLRAAEGYRARGLIEGAALFLQGECRVTGALALEKGDASG